jgi:septal ring factor EnvC (AmiA/AmiB activator)
LEHYLQRLPDGKHRVAVAAALTNAVAKHHARSAFSKHAAGSESWWLSILALPPRAAWGLVGIFLLVLSTGLVFLILDDLHLRRRDEQLRTRMASVDAEQTTLQQEANALQAQFERQQNQIGKLQDQWQGVERRSEAFAKDLAALQHTDSASVQVDLTSASRSLEAPQIVTVPRESKSVTLSISLEGRERYAAYRSVLQTVEGQQVWEQPERRINTRRVTPTIALTLATRRLSAGSYKLTLVLRPETGTELSEDYYFTVVKR